MLLDIFSELDNWIQKENRQRFEQGSPTLDSCDIRILGQTALLEAQLDLTLALTQDVDVFANYNSEIKVQFEVLLKKQGKILDPDSHLIWMPKETQYQKIFSGVAVTGYLAQPEYVLISKGIKAPQKNTNLIVEYLAKKPSKLFFELAQRYKLDLDQFVEDNKS